MDLSGSVSRVRSGQCSRIPLSEYLAWADLCGLIVRPAEYAILRAMDRAFCEVMNEEIKAYQERMREKWQQESKQTGRKRHG